MQETRPRYLKIAVDVAARIASGEFTEKTKLKGRSVLSAEYSVSPETIRRAMSLLSDRSVVEIRSGSGIYVMSKSKAIEFLKGFNAEALLSELKDKQTELLRERIHLDEELLQISQQISEMYRYRRSDLVIPYEIVIPDHSHIIGKSIGELQVWHYTGATIIAVIRDNELVISPGPYYVFQITDVVLIVGDEQVVERFNAFILGYMVEAEKNT